MRGKARKKGWNRKNNSERSKLSGGEDNRLVRFTRQLLLLLLFFFFCQHRVFLLFPQCGAWAQTKRLVVSKIVSTGNGVYTKMVPVLSVTIIIAY